jgi:hypothetical protein
MKRNHLNRLRAMGLVIAGVALGTSASAVPILGASVVVATDGEVIATFLGHTAGFSNDLYLDSPAGAFPGIIFNNQTTPPGTSVSLGNFTAGTELIFRIHVLNTGFDFFTGPASRNPDGIVHAVVDDEFSLTATYVGFEDLLGGGDLDYDDLNFSFTNVRSEERIPDAVTTLPLVALSAGLLAFAGRRSKAQGLAV